MAGYRIIGAGAVAVGALLAAAGTVGARGVNAPVAQYVEPSGNNYVRVADLFGESDEEKAARQQHEDNQDGQIKGLTDKVRDLEDTVRNLTGQNEELSHRVSELSQKLDRQQKEFEYRLCAMAAQQLGSSTNQGDPNAVPCPPGSAPAAAYAPPPTAYAPPAAGYNGPPPPTAYAPPAAGYNGPPPANYPAPPAAYNSPPAGYGAGNYSPAPPRAPAAAAATPPPADGSIRMAPPPGVLGTLPAGAGGAGVAPSVGEDTRAQFSAAMNLLAAARYDEARAAFRSFADTYPRDDLASQAVYWTGDIAYVQKDYGNAARAFAEVIKKYPTSLRAPDSMLKLGQALIASGQKKEGCTALAALPAKYPKASRSVLGQGADARKAVCRGLA
jgi:tol-pal system protein YbgF